MNAYARCVSVIAVLALSVGATAKRAKATAGGAKKLGAGIRNAVTPDKDSKDSNQEKPEKK
jgi:hypothetical protein